MPCPYFYPTHRCSDPLWPHPERLSLGAGFHGRCTASAVVPSGELLHECHLGYAECSHLPADRTADAVALAVRREPKGIVQVQFIREADHAAVAYGVLTFEIATGKWLSRHPDECIQRMAECCVEAQGREKEK